MARVRIEVRGEDHQSTQETSVSQEEELPMSLVGRNVPTDESSRLPPPWLKPTAYLGLAALGAAGIALVIATPRRMKSKD